MSQTFFILSSIQALQSAPVSSCTDDQRNTYTEKKNALFFAVLFQTLTLDVLTSRVYAAQHAFFLQPGPFSFVSSLNRESHMRDRFHCICTGLHPCLM